jgi:hypothetical protein
VKLNHFLAQVFRLILELLAPGWAVRPQLATA